MKFNRFLLAIGILYAYAFSMNTALYCQDIQKPVYKVQSPGVPAAPYLMELKQPDGKVLEAYFRGDRAVHWYETRDGYTIMKNKAGFFEYATSNSKGELVSSGIRANNARERKAEEIAFLITIKKGIRYSPEQIEKLKAKLTLNKSSKGPGKAFPTTGTNNLLVIMIDFPDMENTYSQSSFDNMMNQNNYNGTGSFQDYYVAMSFGQLTVVSTVTRWFTALHNHDYYCDDCPDADPDNTYREIVREAVDSAEADGIDFSVFDNDGDDEVDGVMVIHAGEGAEYGGDTNIWSHSWSLYDLSVTYDGVLINDYTMNPETTPYGMNEIGVFCHEFGHNLGLPDYYDTDYETNGQSFDLGDWDCMAGGSYNNGGATPASHNSYSKYLLDWVTPTELDESMVVTLPNIAENNVAYYYTTPTDDEFFVVENRQQVPGTFDEYIPSHGMLIYHIDRNYSGWDNNTINVNPDSNAMDIEEADDIRDEYPYTYTIDGDPFPGSSNNTSFTDASTPNSLDWSGASTEKPITNIQESAGVITFSFMGGDTLNPGNFTASPVSTTQINLTWNLNSSGHNILLAWSSDGTFGTPVDGTSYSSGNTISGGGTVLYNGSSTSFNHTILTPATRYYYKIWSYDGSTVYSSGTTEDASTFCDIIADLPYVQEFNDGDLPTCWQNIDNDGSGQVWQFNNPGERTINTTTNANGFVILDSDEYGNGYSQDADLVSPVFDLSVYDSVFVSFEHYFLEWFGSSGTFSYSLNGGVTWIDVETWVDETTNPAIFNEDFTAELAGMSTVVFKWNYTGDYGYYWAIDDILIDSTYHEHTLPIFDYDVTFIVIDNSSIYPIQNANVTLDGYGTQQTDVSGTVVFYDVTQGADIPYSISATGYITDSGYIDVYSDETYFFFLDTLTGSVYSVTFNVDNGTDPVSGALISLAGNGSQITNVSGQAVFNDVETGVDIAYTVSATGYDNYDGTVDVIDDDVIENVTLGQENFEVTFIVSDGISFIDSAMIYLGEYDTLLTNASGEAMFHVLPDTGITYLVTKTGYRSASGKINVSGDRSVAITLIDDSSTVYNVTFNVDDGSDPIEGATINLDGYGDKTTNATGQAIYSNVGAGSDINYIVSAEGYNDVIDSLDVVSSDVIANVSMALIVYRVTFNVDDGSDPIEGANVTLTGYGNQNTDSDGQAVFEDVQPENDISYNVTADDFTSVSGTLSVTNKNVTRTIHLVSTGIKELEGDGVISLYPNPSNGKVWLKGISNNKVEVKVFDITGIMVINKTLYGNYMIDLETYAAGTYFIQTQVGEKISYHKLILKK